MTVPTDTSPLGTLEYVDGAPVVRFERDLPHPIDVVWSAVTEPDHLEHWFPTTIDGERATGAPLRFGFREGENVPAFEGSVLTWDPPRVFEIMWGEDRLRLELTPTDTGCRLVLTDTLSSVGKAARDGAGWHVCLDRLRAHLSGRDATAPGSDATPEWQELFDRYVARFGPEASTEGPPDAG